MATMHTDKFLELLGQGQVKGVVMQGLATGSFWMLAVTDDGCYYHGSRNGDRKEYQQLSGALEWLKRKAAVTRVIVTTEDWTPRPRRR